VTNSKRHALQPLLCLLLILCSIEPVAAQADRDGNGWETVYQQGDLSVQRRDYRGSALDEVKGMVRVRSSLNALMALLKDAGFNQQWVYRSGGARILQDAGYAQAWVYGIVDAPFPMQDRDTVVRFDYHQDAATRDITVTITNLPDYIAADPNLVRVPEMGGFWRLRPEADGWVQVTYQVYGDPGGWIPVWLANRAALVSVQYTLANLVSVVDRYAGVTSDAVREPKTAVAD
jgi:hypothetical protein